MTLVVCRNSFQSSKIICPLNFNELVSPCSPAIRTLKPESLVIKQKWHFWSEFCYMARVFFSRFSPIFNLSNDDFSDCSVIYNLFFAFVRFGFCCCHSANKRMADWSWLETVERFSNEIEWKWLGAIWFVVVCNFYALLMFCYSLFFSLFHLFLFFRIVFCEWEREHQISSWKILRITLQLYNCIIYVFFSRDMHSTELNRIHWILASHVEYFQIK